MKRFRHSLVFLAIVSAQAVVAHGEPAKASLHEEIPYASLDEALKALHAKTGVEFREEGGWIVAYDSKAIVSWLLTPPGHPAYPSIVKRHIVNSAAGADMATDIRCFAAQAVCDRYFGGK
jgi:hypothetical protein